jgi:hypothetical protein
MDSRQTAKESRKEAEKVFVSAAIKLIIDAEGLGSTFQNSKTFGKWKRARNAFDTTIPDLYQDLAMKREARRYREDLAAQRADESAADLITPTLTPEEEVLNALIEDEQDERPKPGIPLVEKAWILFAAVTPFMKQESDKKINDPTHDYERYERLLVPYDALRTAESEFYAAAENERSSNINFAENKLSSNINFANNLSLAFRHFLLASMMT